MHYSLTPPTLSKAGVRRNFKHKTEIGLSFRIPTKKGGRGDYQTNHNFLLRSKNPNPVFHLIESSSPQQQMYQRLRKLGGELSKHCPFL